MFGTGLRLDESGILWISSSVERIQEEWGENDSIRSVRFEPNSRLKEIQSFRGWRNLKSVSIPASVEWIYANSFAECPSLTEVIFAADGRLKRIDGFGGCTSLSRIEIPASVEKIDSLAFSTEAWIWWNSRYYEHGSLGDLSRRELIFRSGTRLRPHPKEGCFQGFIIFDDENDLKRRRRQVHL
jgi:hypothetical protein